ncbi:DUF5667 domain-containing protein [Actinacidiphila sp. DG2A-62]|uniref:DUF5667 domain-containing protein n=1 Tax=Actinacidiphila sp. DG2A-62 TaxID=3108821 RepID=UPI002DB6B939|nr:DUF5667 domain-containing protein [Actinacidiphila sp. DG2A-62]MEC3996248.1 DUF5667 domain-containing protein [Actinacidiphila sp. DG2A-62]
MIGQATAHRRANAFAQALEDAGVPGEHGGEPGGPGDASGGGRDQDGPGTQGRTDQHRGPAAGAHGGHGSHAAHGHQHAGHAGHGGYTAAHAGAHAADRRADPEQAALVALAGALSARPRPVMSAHTKTVQRAQLIAAMEQAIADGSLSTGRVPEQRGEPQEERDPGRRASGLRKLAPRSRLSRRLAVGGLTVGVAAGALGGVAAASTNALPGDTLYGLKRGMEDLKLDMAGGDASRGKVYLDMASTRMQEARRLMDRGRGGQLDDESVAEVRKALSGMHQEAAEGHRLLSQAYKEDGSLQPIETLNSFAESHRQGWSDLRGKLPAQLTDVSEQVSSVFAAIDQEVAPLQPLLPAPHDHRHGSSSHDDDGRGSGGSGTAGARTPSPSQSTASGAQDGTGTGQSPTPSPSGTTPQGLIGGAGGLLPEPPATTPTTGTPTPSPTDPQHSVVLPPLLPGLLPGLGLNGADDDPNN